MTPQDVLSREEIRELVEPSDWRGAFSLITTWALIAASLALVATFRTNPWAWLIALFLLGGRQLALAILMHECSHRSLFKTRILNDVLGKWLCAAPVWQRLDDYRKHHLTHHTRTSFDDDPDIGLARPFPVSRAALCRKLLRDLLGATFVRRVVAQLAMDFGYLTYTASTTATLVPQKGRDFRDALRDGARNFGPVLLSNLALYLVLTACGSSWLYLVWALANATTFNVFVRVRSMAEHALTDVGEDITRNTRTMIASPIARLTVAPHHVNYHIEHHLLMTVPHYRLKRLHRLLVERGALSQARVERSYVAIVRAMAHA